MTEPAEPADELTCKELVEVVTAYLDGAMGDADRSRFERHLGECSGCTAVVSQFRTTIEITGRLTEEQVSEKQREAMRGVFRRWRGATTS
ncbi:MAG TPA: zf-HC2 domain-containing protein [Gaiellaceae bacterium]|nr:zf-HC2 domain-containing protein [Gaiellaceae bacterium]